jgi:hypothetical protein
MDLLHTICPVKQFECGAQTILVRGHLYNNVMTNHLGVECMVKSGNELKDPLRVVPHAQGFYFYTTVGDYCGVSAHSLEEFANALQYVCSGAIVFHFERGDFQNWIRDVIGDAELAQSIDDIKMCERHLAAESCRKELVELVRVRMLQLEVAKGPPCFGEKKGK